MNKAAIVRDVSLKLADAEGAIDEAIAKSARLIEGLMQARGALRLSTVAGGGTGGKLAVAMAELMAARAETAAAHGELAELQGQLGLKRMNFSADFVGPLDKPPPPSGELSETHEAEVRPLRRV